jgi:hypothetical protein
MANAVADVALEIVRASGIGLLRGKVTIPTPRLVSIARQATAKVKVVESIDLVPADGEARLHLVLAMMGDVTRVVVRAAVASFHLASGRDVGGQLRVVGALRLRLLEPPTFAGRFGGKSGGILGMIGAFGEAALASMGPEKITSTVAEFMGPPLSARGDVLSIDLAALPQVRKALARATPLGSVGELVHVTGARFRPGGLELTLRLRPRVAVSALVTTVLGRRRGPGDVRDRTR